MINELYALSETLSQMNITTEEWHREYLPISIATCYRLWLSEAGSVDGVDILNPQIAANVRKFGNNQAAFPAFNITAMYWLRDPAQIEHYEMMFKGKAMLNLDMLRSWCIADNRVTDKSGNSIVDKRMRSALKKAHELIAIIEKTEPQSDNAVTQLMRAMERYSRESFHAALESFAFAQLQKGEDVEICLKLLFEPDKENKSKTAGNIPIVLDLYAWEKFDYPVAHEQSTGWINSMLLQNSDIADDKNGDALDAFGRKYSEIKEPMPEVKPGSLVVKLRSMYNVHHCHYRYGKIDDASYPIAKESRASTKMALEWISKPEKRGSTWQAIDRDEMLFVYPSVLPEIDIEYVDLFYCSEREKEIYDRKSFEETAKGVIQALRAIPTSKKSDTIRVFAIRKMDKARTKVVFERNITPENLIRCAEEWQEGCENIPTMNISAFPKFEKGKKLPPSRANRTIPYPLEFPRIINDVWKQDGSLAQGEKSKTNRMRYYQGMELMLDALDKPILNYYLHILLSHSIGLIQNIGNSLHHGNALSENKAKAIMPLLSAIGLLLYKTDNKKGDYMESTGYLVGQLLKASDELHTLYCYVVRGGDIPIQLAGNSVFVSASENPAQALAQLCARMNPYITWAKQYRSKNIDTKGQESWRARWLLSLCESIATKLGPLLRDNTRFADYEKAQVFIGYLAAFPQKESKENGGENNE